MKKSTIIITALAMLAVFVFSSYYYARIYKPAHTNTETSSIYNPKGIKKEHSGKRILLAELAEEDFHLYQDGDYTILIHGNQEAEFDDWSSMIAEETPELYYFDFNNDNENELVIRALEGIDERTNEKYYCIYVLFITEDENGNYNYRVAFANRSTWYSTFDSIVNCEVSQPKINKKRVQLAMEQTRQSIRYNSETGIVNGSHAWFIKALSDNKNNYYTFREWYMGPGIITVNTKEKYLQVQINLYITYNETKEAQIGGVLKCGLDLKGKNFEIRERSVSFTTNPEYRVSSLIKLADSDWQYIFHNIESYSSADKTIDNAAFRCTLSEKSMEEHSVFSGSTAETKAIDKIILNKNSIKLYAKKGYKFSQNIVDSLNYSVDIQVGGTRADITLSASIGEEDGASVLTFLLDKDYPIEELKNFNVKLG